MKSTYGMYRPGIYNCREIEKEIKPIPNSDRVRRIIKLIKYLNDWKNAKQIAEHLEVSTKSIYRYIDLLVDLGFKVQRGHKKYTYYRVVEVDRFFSDGGTTDIKKLSSGMGRMED